MNTSTVLPLMVSQAIPRNHTDRHKTHADDADGANFFHLADRWLARSLALVNSWIAQMYETRQCTRLYGWIR